ncbi:MAG: hypothetical protein II794_05160 [Oscillospiraceae bacterium]|nr:hypothetical protein [Oscillospiraceae bacterium]
MNKSNFTRRAAVLLAGVFLVLLSACSPSASSENGEEPEPGRGEEAHFEYSPTPTSTYWDSVFYTAVKTVNKGFFLYYSDVKTGDRGILCGRPDCMHDDASCNAFFPVVQSISAYDGKIYVMSGDGVISVDPDGTGRETVKDFKAKNPDGSYSFILPAGGYELHIHNGIIYYLNDEATVNEGVPKSRGYLFSMGPEPGQEVRTLFRQEYEYTSPNLNFCPCSDGFYLHITSTPEAEWDPEKEVYVITAKKVEVLRFRDGDSRPETVYSAVRDKSDTRDRKAFADSENNLLFFGSKEHRLYMLKDGELEEIILFEDNGDTFTGTAWPFGDMYLAFGMVDGQREILVKNTDNETVYRGPLGLEALKADGIDPARLTVSYLGYAGNRLFFQFSMRGKATYYMAYELTEEGFREQLLLKV